MEQQLLERDQAIQRMSSEQELRDAKTEQVQQALVRKAGEACTLASVATHTHEPPSLAPPPGAGAGLRDAKGKLERGALQHQIVVGQLRSEMDTDRMAMHAVTNTLRTRLRLT